MEGDVESILPRPLPIESPLSPIHRSQSLDQALSRSPGSPSSTSPPTASTQRGEIEKWDAWHACAGMSRTEAKRQYIDYLIGTMKRYACGTQEGRELVGELEFVWDQIKHNSVSSHGGSGSSNDSANGRRRSRPGLSGRESDTRQGRSRSGIPAGQFDRNEPSSRPLRVLSPVSRGDGGDVSATEDDDADEEYDDEGRPRASSSPSKRTSSGGRTPADQRKWKQRIETALSRLSVEVAALREQMSDSRIVPRRRPGSVRWIWAWAQWLIWTTIQQIAFDLILLSCAVLYGRWAGDRRIEDAIRGFLVRWRDRIKSLLRSRRWWIWRLISRFTR